MNMYSHVCVSGSFSFSSDCLLPLRYPPFPHLPCVLRSIMYEEEKGVLWLGPSYAYKVCDIQEVEIHDSCNIVVVGTQSGENMMVSSP